MRDEGAPIGKPVFGYGKSYGDPPLVTWILNCLMLALGVLCIWFMVEACVFAGHMLVAAGD
jgi:hypothetical protein